MNDDDEPVNEDDPLDPAFEMPFERLFDEDRTQRLNRRRNIDAVRSRGT